MEALTKYSYGDRNPDIRTVYFFDQTRMKCYNAAGNLG